MNRLEIRTRMRNVLDELSETNTHWESDRLNRYIEEGKDDIVGQSPSLALPKLWATEPQHLSNGVNLYSLPINMCSPIEFFLYGTKANTIPIEMEGALLKNAMYAYSQTDPYVIYPYSEGQVKIYPTPVALVINGFVTHYLRLTVPLTSDSSIPELPYNMHQWIVDYGIWRALVEDGDGRAESFHQKYMSHFTGGR